MSCARCGHDVRLEDFGPDDAATCPGCVPDWLHSDNGMAGEGGEECLTSGIPRAAIIDYLIRSYGTVFVEELTNRLPHLRTKPRPS